MTVTRQLSEQLAREADRLARIVDDLLDLSLIEAQEAPSREPVPVRVALDEAVERVRLDGARARDPAAGAARSRPTWRSTATRRRS